MKLLFTQDALVNAGAERSHLEILSRFSEEVDVAFVYFYPKHDLKEAYERAGIQLFDLAVGDQRVESTRNRPLIHVYGAGSIYRKFPILTLFERGFAPALMGRKGEKMSAGDDVEWCYLMQLMGYRIAFDPKLKFEHHLPSSRLTWDYYLGLKRGISSSSALLYPYRYFSSTHSKWFFGYGLSYALQTLQALLLYLKYKIRWKGSPKKPQDQVSYIILKARVSSYLRDFRNSMAHYRQLLKYFGT